MLYDEGEPSFSYLPSSSPIHGLIRDSLDIINQSENVPSRTAGDEDRASINFLVDDDRDDAASVASTTICLDLEPLPETRDNADEQLPVCKVNQTNHQVTDGLGPIRSNRTVCHDLRRQEYKGFISIEEKKVAAMERAALALEEMGRLLKTIADK